MPSSGAYSATTSLELVAALRRGEVVAVQPDRALGTCGDVPILFFGKPAPFPLGPFLLAAAVGVPMAPAFCLLGADHRYTVTVADPFDVPRGAEVEAARAWVALLEGVVREHPTQWFNFFDIWRTGPAWPAPPGARTRPRHGPHGRARLLTCPTSARRLPCQTTPQRAWILELPDAVVDDGCQVSQLLQHAAIGAQHVRDEGDKHGLNSRPQQDPRTMITSASSGCPVMGRRVPPHYGRV